jgi:FkbM family methyltransferase
MTLDLVSLVKEHNLNIKGVIQGGSHFWQERETFLSLGIENFVLIEPQSHAFKVTQERSQDIPGAILFNCAISDTEGQMQLHCDTDNQGQSSSLLYPKEHLERCNWVHFDHQETVEVKKLDNLEFDRSKMNLLALDLQGNELNALKGATETLKYLDAVYLEVNYCEMYEGCALVEDIDAFLSQYGFKRVAEDHVFNGWGDALYIK